MKRKKARTFKYAGALLLLAGIKTLDAISRISGMAEDRKRESAQVIVPIMYALSRRTDREYVRSDTLRVMTLNIAHGRKNGRHQLLRRTSTIQANLDDVAVVLQRQSPDVVALQEADGPSAWSGSFDHVRYVAEKAGLAYSIRGEHVKRKNTSYGTAILSDFPIDTSVSVTFSPSPPTFSKGYVMSTVEVPGNRAVDVVSVHLDFSRKAIRERQALEIAERLRKRTRPLIVMGDFNCDWASREMTLRLLMDSLRLTAYCPGAKNMITFPKSNRRLDWILVSSDFEFVTCNVIGDTLSDHQGVIADVRLK
ncbi:MAG: endonuclease/exonuclease/phosphatase family protein [Deltaproteobacteria bacterium]|nr:endonuclease/exonuclease/phosphatase family protein [Deltaproteobacteria bacterium]